MDIVFKKLSFKDEDKVKIEFQTKALIIHWQQIFTKRALKRSCSAGEDNRWKPVPALRSEEGWKW